MNSEGSKTEKPTPKKLKDAKKEGNVAYSHDLSMFMGIMVILMFVVFGRTYIIDCFAKNYALTYALIKNQQFDLHILYNAGMEMLKNMTVCMLVMTTCAAIAVMLTTTIQLGGLVFKEDLFKFDINKFNIVENAKQMFSKKNLAKFAFNVIKLTIMFLLSYWLVKNYLHEILQLVTLPLIDMLLISSVIILKIIIVLLATYFVFGVIDLVIEKRALYKQLMMSLEEIKDEMKQVEGNMEVKQRLRELRQEMMAESDSMFSQYKESMLVLANPTHIAILILYLPKRWGLPVTIFKGKGPIAKYVFRIAKKHGVPVIREKWLARKLFELAILNQFVPLSLVKDVAEVIGKNLHLLPKIAEDIAMAKTSPEAANTIAKPRASNLFNNLAKPN